MSQTATWRETDEMEKLHEEYSDTNGHVQECLDALRKGNGSHYLRISRRSGRSVKSVQSQQSENMDEVKHQIVLFEKKVIGKEQRSLEEEYFSKQEM